MDIERVLLIFMVIVLHYNNRGMGGALNYAAVGGMNEFILRLSESLCICAVDAFLLLSGFFAAKQRNVENVPWKKAIWLLVSCSFYRVIGYVCYACFVTKDFSIRTLLAYIIPSNWYVCLFVTVLLLSPFVCRLLNGLEDTKRRELLIISSLLFVLVPTVTVMGADLAGVDLNGLSTISIMGDIDGFTIVSFVYCYILGFNLEKEKDNIYRYKSFVWIGIYLITAVVSALISFKSEKVWSYSSVFCVVEALTITNAFICAKEKESKGLGGWLISSVGSAGLGIFIWHTMPLMVFGYWVHWNIDTIGELSAGGYLMNLLGATLSMYVLSAVWVCSCRGIVKGIRKINKIDKK